MNHYAVTLSIGFVGLILFIIGYRYCNLAIYKNTGSEALKGLLLICLSASMILGSILAELIISKREKSTIVQFELEVKYDKMAESAIIFDKTHEIPGDKAWWIGKTPEQLTKDCQAIASKTGYDWHGLLVLLSDKNCTVTFTPAGIKPQP